MSLGLKHIGHLICIDPYYTPEGYDCLMKKQQYVSRGYAVDDAGNATVLLVGKCTHKTNHKGYEIGYGIDRFRCLEAIQLENRARRFGK